MKELYIIETSYIPTAAATNRLFALGLALVKKGVKVKFIYLTPDDCYHMSDRYIDIFDFVYLWKSNLLKNKYWCAFWSLKKLKKILQPDIPVYIYSSLNLLPFIRKKGFRVYHEYTENPNVVGRIHNLVGEYFYNKYVKAVQNVDGLFVITPSLKKLYEQNFHVSSDKIEILNMVVDPRRFENMENIEPEDSISYCGIISEFKDGVNYLIQSFAKFVKAHPTYKLNIYGRFESEEVKLKILQKVEELGISTAVKFAGSVSSFDMPFLLRKSKILALARPDNEQAKYGFATKIGEYLLAERPIVLTDVGDFKLYLKNNVDVIYAKPDNVDNFAEKLTWIAENYEEAEVIAKHGKLTALKSFNSEIEAEKIYKKIFTEL